MTELRYDNALGKLGDSLSSSGTAINFGATAPPFATLTGSDYIKLILEPATDVPSANYEVAYLTAYTATATTGTILRAQEGTTGVAHASGVLWVCGPTSDDFELPSSVVTVASGTPSSGQIAQFNGTGNEVIPVAAPSGSSLAPTAVKTANYTAAVSDFVPCDVSGGSFTVTLPTAPADKTQIGVKVIKPGSIPAPVIVACGGSDVFNIASGATTLRLSSLAQGVLLQYSASPAIWYVVGDDTPLAGNVFPAGQIESLSPVLERRRTQVSPSLMATTNAASALTISTPDSSGQVVEPAVEYIPWGWNGHKYWALITGYTNGTASTENPSLYYSDDGLIFTDVGGSFFPIVSNTEGFADPEIVLGPDNKLHMFWIAVRSGPGTTTVYWTTYDGTTLSTPTAILATTNTTEAPIAPVFMWDGANNQWVMWYTDGANFYNSVSAAYPYKRRTIAGTSPGGTMSSATTTTVNGVPGGKSIWESHIARRGEELHMVTTCCTIDGGGTGTALYFGVSDDGGLTWTLDSTPILTASASGWDNGMIYRGDIVPLDDASSGAYQLWYSAVNSGTTWKMGYTTITRNQSITTIGGVTFSGTPSIGEVPIATSSSAATWQNPPAGGGGSAYQNGVLNLGDVVISSISINTSTGALTFTLASASPVIVNGTQVTYAGGTYTKSIGAITSGDYAVIGVEIDSSGSITVVTGTSTATQLNTGSLIATNTPATTSGKLRVADLALWNNSGTYNFSDHTTTATQGTNWIDRRPWARGFQWVVEYTGGNFTTTGTSLAAISTAHAQGRVECSGVPLRVTVFAACNHSANNGVINAGLNKDGSGIGTILMQLTLPVAGDAMPFLLEYVDTPAAGSHLYAPTWDVASGTGTINATANTPFTFVIEELVRQNANNGVS